MKVGVAMSGGVDSTAAALLLKEQGHDVVGLHIYMHEYSRYSWGVVQEIAHKIGVPVSLVDLRSHFREMVIGRFLSEYAQGRTPSPCLVCNKLIKMGLLREHALSLGCDMVATGHYARVVHTARNSLLLKGVDVAKDQSYFLAMVPRESLAALLLPLGSITKTQTREIVQNMGISIPRSADSQELCFIHGQTYKEYLIEHGVMSAPGPIVDVHGRVLGEHRGIMGFTVGQRKGLGISAPHPLYVVAIDSQTHTIVVGPVEHTFVDSIEIEQFNELGERPVQPGEVFRVKVRSTSAPVSCTAAAVEDTALTLRFHKPERGVAPGQAAVLYREDEVVGGGWIYATKANQGVLSGRAFRA
jgi:tRNA-specific 2-thiouridylase